MDTVDTIRVRSLLEFTHTARKHTLIVGESGIGKTALINDFIDTQGCHVTLETKYFYLCDCLFTASTV